jgi:ubiquinone/menaquinone biosynthesis C-methylase UbiE
MNVLEVGPGNGTFTLAAARRLGPEGKIVAIDIEPKMIDRVQKRSKEEGVTNVEAQVADVFDLPFEDESFDLIYMIAVIGEIPNPELAMRSFHRVLKPTGRLVFSELLMDPDYPSAQTLARWAAAADFQIKELKGNLFYYTLIFEKAYPSACIA